MPSFYYNYVLIITNDHDNKLYRKRITFVSKTTLQMRSFRFRIDPPRLFKFSWIWSCPGRSTVF